MKGREKIKWMLNYIPNVYEMDEQPSLKELREQDKLNIYCNNHINNDTSHCALRNVILLKNLLLKKK